MIQTVIDKHEKNKKSTEILFLNQKKTYDKMLHFYLWTVMRKIDLSKKFIRTIKTLYAENTIISWLNDKKDNEIFIRDSVRQEDSLFCLLFNIIIKSLNLMIIKNHHLKDVKLSLRKKMKIFVCEWRRYFYLNAARLVDCRRNF